MVRLRKYLEHIADTMKWISEKEESTMPIRFWALIAERFRLPFTEKVEEQVKWGNRAGFECGDLKCSLDIQVEILSRVGHVSLDFKGERSGL